MGLLLNCEKLSKFYGPFPAVVNIDLNIESDKIIGLLGPNGSGKTTFMKLAAGLLTPTMGNISILGNPVGEETKKIVSYLPDSTYLSNWMTVKDAVNFFKDFYFDFSEIKAYEMLENLKINPKIKLKALSKGNREKVQLILVMARDARLYLLDEPIAGVDPAARYYILDTIITNRSPGSSVIISTHLIYDIEPVLTDFLFINRGEIFMQNTVEAARNYYGKSIDQLFREVFRC